MKFIFVLPSILITYTCIFSQPLKKQIQGKWICKSITDSVGNDTIGTLGYSGRYLQLEFSGNSLLISKSPFGRSSTYVYTLNKADSIIDRFPFSSFTLPESKYKITHLNDSTLTLKGKTIWNNSVFYHLNKTNINTVNIRDSQLVDAGFIILKHIETSEKHKYGNSVSEYNIENRKEYDSPLPSFFDKGGDDFGGYLTRHFKFPVSFAYGTISEEMIVDFFVTKDGAHNFIINKGIDSSMDKEFLSVLEKTTKLWRPVKFKNKKYTTQLRFHIIFNRELMSSLKDWSKDDKKSIQ